MTTLLRSCLAAADIATSLEAFLASQRQHVSQSRELPDTVDLDQRLCLWIVRVSGLLDQRVVVLDLLRHIRDLPEHRTKRLSQTWRQHRHAPLGEAQRGRGWQTVAAGLGQSTHRVHRCRPQTNNKVASPDQRQSFLLGNRAMGDRPQDLRIEPSVAGQLLRIDLIALPIAVGDRTQLTYVRYDDLVTQFLKLFADPDRTRPRCHRNPYSRQIGKPLLDSPGAGSEPTSVNHFSVLVERAVIAPDIPKVDPDRYPNPGAAAWNFSDEVMRWLLHGE